MPLKKEVINHNVLDVEFFFSVLRKTSPPPPLRYAFFSRPYHTIFFVLYRLRSRGRLAEDKLVDFFIKKRVLFSLNGGEGRFLRISWCLILLTIRTLRSPYDQVRLEAASVSVGPWRPRVLRRIPGARESSFLATGVLAAREAGVCPSFGLPGDTLTNGPSSILGGGGEGEESIRSNHQVCW